MDFRRFLGGQALSPAASSTTATGAGGGSTASGTMMFKTLSCMALEPNSHMQDPTHSASMLSKTGDVGGDIAQHLKRLTKREAVTRVKALQVFEPVLCCLRGISRGLSPCPPLACAVHCLRMVPAGWQLRGGMSCRGTPACCR